MGLKPATTVLRRGMSPTAYSVRGTLGIRLWRHSKTCVRTQACACEAGNIVGDEQPCCLVTPKNPQPLRRGESQLVRPNSSPHSHLHFTAARSKKTACATLEP